MWLSVVNECFNKFPVISTVGWSSSGLGLLPATNHMNMTPDHKTELKILIAFERIGFVKLKICY